MHARDASGRQVSLLNDDTTVSHSQVSQHHESAPQFLAYRTASHMSTASYHGSYGRSPSPFPNTPELLRSDSYDSQMSNEPISPITPMYDYSGARVYTTDARSPYEDYYSDPQQQFLQQQANAHAYTSSKQLHQSGSDATAYDEEAAAGGGNGLGASGGKRYPCRYRESHGCEKTFTTSGHASRHSKIHTAEKAVQCTFAGCSKKFTRADNMKQHLETHYKDKSRSSGSSSSSSSSRPSLSSSERRSSSSTASGKSSSRSSKSSSASGTTSRTTPLTSPSIRGAAWDFRGLDALAMAVACQEGA